MKYQEFIDNILKTRGRFNCNGYKERHHIIPKCMGGTNDEGNLIDLYPREHFIAHKLLAEENKHVKELQYAWILMSNYDKYECTGEDYEYLRNNYINTKSISVYCVEQDKIYMTMTEASNATNTSLSSISMCCAGQLITANNMHWCLSEYKDNKDFINQLLSKKNKQERQVWCHELQRAFDTIKDAEIITGVHRVYIRKCCINEQNVAGNLHFCYLEDKDTNEFLSKLNAKATTNGKPQQVYCVELNKVFRSLRQAQEETKIDKSVISKCCKGKYKMAGGYHWQYCIV